MRSLAAALTLTLLPVSVAVAQPHMPPPPDMPIDAATRAQVIERAAAAYQKDYVFPDVAKKIASSLRANLAAKKYDKLDHAIAFADALTADLKAVAHDGHARVVYSFRPVPDDRRDDASPSADDLALLHLHMQRINAGFIKVERLPGNIGYLRLDGFTPAHEAAPRAAAAMGFLADTDALIIDLRQNGGGDPECVQLLVSYLYAPGEQVHINDIYSRPDNSTREFWTLGVVTGPRYVRKPVYVLTSHRTFSGAEEFAYDLKMLKRGTIVGETTGGGAHPGGPHKLGEHFFAIVPTGRAINPVSKTDWEGTGVKPDIAVAEADALDAAYRAALTTQRSHVDAHDAPFLSNEIDEALARLAKPVGSPAPAK